MADLRYIFVQDNQEGLASYHLTENAGGCYISYADCPSKLDNGEKPPEKKYFDLAKFNIEERTFSGQIIWDPITFSGCVQWDYEFEFDNSLITWGNVVTTYNDGSTETIKFNDYLNYKLLRTEPCDDSHTDTVLE